ncbi:MAG: hypothetical protein MMC33_006845 [Icmadophila ericetorum]|nr:hypothetical protein [Icmadophila ericetorum]
MVKFSLLPPKVRTQIFKHAFIIGTIFPLKNCPSGQLKNAEGLTFEAPFIDWAWAVSSVGSEYEDEARFILWRYNKVSMNCQTVFKLFGQPCNELPHNPVLSGKFGGWIRSICIEFICGPKVQPSDPLSNVEANHAHQLSPLSIKRLFCYYDVSLVLNKFILEELCFDLSNAFDGMGSSQLAFELGALIRDNARATYISLTRNPNTQFRIQLAFVTGLLSEADNYPSQLKAKKENWRYKVRSKSSGSEVESSQELSGEPLRIMGEPERIDQIQGEGIGKNSEERRAAKDSELRDQALYTSEEVDASAEITSDAGSLSRNGKTSSITHSTMQEKEAAKPARKAAKKAARKARKATAESAKRTTKDSAIGDSTESVMGSVSELSKEKTASTGVRSTAEFATANVSGSDESSENKKDKESHTLTTNEPSEDTQSSAVSEEHPRMPGKDQPLAKRLFSAFTFTFLKDQTDDKASLAAPGAFGEYDGKPNGDLAGEPVWEPNKETPKFQTTTEQSPPRKKKGKKPKAPKESPLVALASTPMHKPEIVSAESPKERPESSKAPTQPQKDHKPTQKPRLGTPNGLVGTPCKRPKKISQCKKPQVAPFSPWVIFLLGMFSVAVCSQAPYVWIWFLRKCGCGSGVSGTFGVLGCLLGGGSWQA